MQLHTSKSKATGHCTAGGRDTRDPGHSRQEGIGDHGQPKPVPGVQEPEAGGAARLRRAQPGAQSVVEVLAEEEAKEPPRP